MRATLTLAVLFVFGASAAYADRWVSSKKLPKPVDYPIVRKNVKEHHKVGKKANHPPAPIG
jgi:hypothetical protein